MKHIFIFATALTLATTGVAVFAGTYGSGHADPKVGEGSMTGQILIRFTDATTEDEALRIIARIGAREIGRMMDGKIYLVEIPYPSSQDSIVDALSATEGVVYAEPSQTVSIPKPPEGQRNDDGKSELIGLPQVD